MTTNAISSDTSVHVVGVLDLSTLIALIALLVSVVALLRPWWAGRKANFDIRLNEYRTPGRDRPAREARLVLHNAGPSAAKQVRVTVLDRDDRPYDRVFQDALPQPIPAVQAGQEFHWPIGQGFGGPVPTSAKITWRDGRWQSQSCRIWLSTQIVL